MIAHVPEMDPAPESTTPDLTLPCLIHDLNNVFQTLVEAADLLSSDPRWLPVSDAIFRSIERGKEISWSLLTVNQPSALFDTVLANAMSFVEDSMIAGRGPAIHFECDIQPGLVLRQCWAWERVLINLFSNAVRAMPRGGVIGVAAKRRGNRIEIVVADQGSGIEPELLPDIFQPHISTKGSGGLGLHIVQTIVQQQDGEVCAANRSGSGAEFTITIPSEEALIRSANA